MRETMDTVPMRGNDRHRRRRARRRRPCFTSARKVGRRVSDGRQVPEVDIAVDPLEGTNLCATGAPARSRCWLLPKKVACSTRPIATWRRSSSVRPAKHAVDLDAPVADNLKNIARRLQRGVDDLVVIVLDRPRHEKLIADIRRAGARIKLIGDGDLSAGIAAAVIGTGVHCRHGIGRRTRRRDHRRRDSRCLNGYMLGTARHQQGLNLKSASRKMGIKDKNQDLRSPRSGSRQADDLRRHRRH